MEVQTVTGVGAAATARAAIEGLGRQGRVDRMLEQIGWRRETRLEVDGEDLGTATDHVAITVVERREPNCHYLTVTGLQVAGVAIPLSSRSRRLKELGGGRWRIGRRTFDVIQPPGEGSRRWP